MNRISDNMNLLDKKNRYNALFDFYGVLLTPKQQEYFKAYYFEDLSLKEVAEEYDVSRNAIFDQLQKIYKILDEYEVKLSLYKKYLIKEEVYQEYLKLDNKQINDLIKLLKNME